MVSDIVSGFVSGFVSGLAKGYIIQLLFLLIVLLYVQQVMAESQPVSDLAESVPSVQQTTPKTTLKTTSKAVPKTEQRKQPGQPEALEPVENKKAKKSFSFYTAERGKQASDNSHSNQALNVSLGLIFILLLIFSMAWFMRKMGYSNISGQANLKILATLNLGQKEKIVLLQIGKQQNKQQILVGVTANQINTLHILKEPVEDETDETIPEQGFAEKLTQSLSHFKKVK